MMKSWRIRSAIFTAAGHFIWAGVLFALMTGIGSVKVGF
jgi:hypothetical protein